MASTTTGGSAQLLVAIAVGIDELAPWARRNAHAGAGTKSAPGDVMHTAQIIDWPLLDDAALASFGAGTHFRAHDEFGAHVTGAARAARFALWAPRAREVSVVGDFNDWDPGRDPMRRASHGCWEAWLPHAREGDYYKYCIIGHHGEAVLHTDPFGRAFEQRPGNAALVTTASIYAWNDNEWLQRRAQADHDGGRAGRSP